MKLSARSIFLPTIIALIFIYFLLSLIKDTDLVHVFISLKPNYLLLAFLSYLIVAVFRTLRIYTIYSDERLPFVKVWGVSNLHTFISNILPSRLGEVSFVYLMRNVFGQHLGRNTVALIYIRIMDTFIVTAIFIITAIAVGFTQARVDAMAFLFVFVVLLGVLSFYLDYLVVTGVSIIKAFLTLMRLGNLRHVGKFLIFLDTLAGFKILRSKGIYWRNLFFTAGIWTFLLLANKAMTLAMGMDLSYTFLFFASTGAVLTSLIPISSLAAIGTYELGWIGAFTLIGLSRDQAIVTGLTIHTVNFVYSMILGLIGFVVIRLHKPKSF